MELPKDKIGSVAVPGLFMARHRVGVNSMAHFTGACMLHLTKMSALPLIWMTDLPCLHVSNLVFQDITITHWTIRSHFVWSERVCNPWRLFVMYMFRNSSNYTEKKEISIGSARSAVHIDLLICESRNVLSTLQIEHYEDIFLLMWRREHNYCNMHLEM